MSEFGTRPIVALDCGGDSNVCLEARLLRARIDRFLAEFDCTRCSTPNSGSLPTAVEVRSVLRSRNLRQRYFEPRFCRDPAWDMLLELFATWLASAPVTVSSLCLVAPASATTALRWISAFEDAGLVLRHPDLGDRRKVYLSLSDEAAGAMDAYFRALPDLRGI